MKRPRISGMLGGQRIDAEVKTFPGYIKAVDAAKGTFTAVVSVFGNVDYGNDRMIKGAFEPAIAARGLPPMFWNHNWPDGPIGASTAQAETDEGWEVSGSVFKGYDLPDRVLAWMLAAQESGAKVDFSFAYDVAEGGATFVKENGQQIREITALAAVYEFGPVVVGMNPDTRLVEAASRRKQIEPVEGSYEERQEDLAEAIAAVEGDGSYVSIGATFDDSVVYTLYAIGADGWITGEPETYMRTYTIGADDDAITLGDRVAVEMQLTIVADTDDGKGLAPVLIDGRKHQNAPTHIQKAHDALVKAGAKCSRSDDEGKAARDATVNIDRDRQVRALSRRRDEEDTRHEQAG